MPSDPSDDVTTVVIEMEPGWLYVKIADPKPEPDRIEFFLRRTIDDWFDAHPAFAIDKAEAVTIHGEMLGIHVWYHETHDSPKMSPQESETPKDTFSIEVHGLIAQQFSREYIEAVVDDAFKILRQYKDRHDTLVVINPRRVAVLLDKQTHRGAVLPLELVEQVIDGAVKAKLKKWFSEPPSLVRPLMLMEISKVVVPSSAVTVHVGDSLKPVPCARILSNQQPLRHDLTAPGDTLQQAASSEPIVVPAEPMILKYKRKRRRNGVLLAEESIVGGYAVCAKEKDGKSRRSVSIALLAIPL